MIMGKVLLSTKKAANWTAEEMSIRAEQPYYLLQTLTENFNNMEEVQRLALIEIARNFSGDVNSWFSAQESRKQ